MDKIEIFCKKCKKKLGDVREDYQYFEVDNVNLFFATKIFCKCGRHFIFFPKKPPESLTAEQVEISNQLRGELGTIKKYRHAKK